MSDNVRSSNGVPRQDRARSAATRRRVTEETCLASHAVVLNYYQLRIDAVQPDKVGVPDGFIFKWRYVWAILLAGPFSEKAESTDQEFGPIDELVEQIFDVYSIGAVHEPGRVPGSEEEFLTRLGIGLKVREPDVLGFPEQIGRWASARLKPFDDSYFVPRFGMRFEEIAAWVDRLVGIVEAKLNIVARDLGPILADTRGLQEELARGETDIGRM